jgi:hypothetical protein
VNESTGRRSMLAGLGAVSLALLEMRSTAHAQVHEPGSEEPVVSAARQRNRRSRRGPAGPAGPAGPTGP